ncbi:hypothetical protein K474DRAFT_1666771 [Panus rudis PR-1116 ss-1]|nr:hypothetical protein K474DRAFT_1666771 [Panus rudis PR-1116 ss-1]
MLNPKHIAAALNGNATDANGDASGKWTSNAKMPDSRNTNGDSGTSRRENSTGGGDNVNG